MHIAFLTRNQVNDIFRFTTKNLRNKIRSASASARKAISFLEIIATPKNTKKRTCEVAIHFNKEPYALSDFEFLMVEQLCNGSVNNNSLEREAFWCAQLCTLIPHGLNLKDASSTPGIAFVTINTILLLYFIVFSLRFSGCFY